MAAFKRSQCGGVGRNERRIEGPTGVDPSSLVGCICTCSIDPAGKLLCDLMGLSVMIASFDDIEGVNTQKTVASPPDQKVDGWSGHLVLSSNHLVKISDISPTRTQSLFWCTMESNWAVVISSEYQWFYTTCSYVENFRIYLRFRIVLNPVIELLNCSMGAATNDTVQPDPKPAII